MIYIGVYYIYYKLNFYCMSEKPASMDMPDIEGIKTEKAAKIKECISKKYADQSIESLTTRLDNIKGKRQNPPRLDLDTIDPDWEKRILNAETPEELKIVDAQMTVTDIIEAMEEVLEERKQVEGL